MHARHLLIGLGLFFGLSEQGLGAPKQVDAPTTMAAPVDLTAILEPFRAQGKIPGMVALVMRGDRIVGQGAVGVRKQGADERVTLDDQFHLGSCTKAMTATLAAMLVEEGKLKWTSTLGEVFGGEFKEMNPAWRSVTIQQVLAHRSGLQDPGMVGYFFLLRSLRASKESLPAQRQKIAAQFLSRAPAAPPGSKFEYSNIGYIIAGAALEKVAGCAWEDLMRERIFKPLGLASAGFGAPGTPGKIDEPWGHDEDSGKPHDPGSRDADFPPAGGPAGNAHMTIFDWAKFILLHLRGDPANPNHHATLLLPETFALLHHPAKGENYMAGWGIGRAAWADGHRPGDLGRVLTHDGDNTSFHCDVTVAPEIDFAVLVMCNRGDSDDNTAICAKVRHALRVEFAPGPVTAK